MTIELLLGKSTDHLVPLEGTKFFVHAKMLADFYKLQAAAKEDGLNLQVISAFRSYERQLTIWNSKARGERQLTDDHGNALNFHELSPTQIIFAILRWSALPGCSRHHWGTDIDVFDGSTQKPEEVKLVPSECIDGGPAALLHEWLDHRMRTKTSYGFYRPYETDRGGVAPEKWHLSYSPVASKLLEKYSIDVFFKHLQTAELELKDELLQHAEEIYQRFLINVDLP